VIRMAAIEKHATYDVGVGGHSYPGFFKESDWEGFYKLRNSSGQVVIVDKDPAITSRLNIVRASKDLKFPGEEVAGMESLGKFKGVFEPTHTHIENCSDYQLLCVSNLKATKKDWGKQAVYTDGEDVWSRPWHVFQERYSPKK